MMLSRVAETLYWMARYLERAEDLTRLLVAHNNLIDESPSRFQLSWSSILNIVGLKADFDEKYSQQNEQSVLQYLISDESNTSSLLSCILGARENARTIREIISSEVWHRINRIYLFLKEHNLQAIPKNTRITFFEEVIAGVQAVNGAQEGSFSRDRTLDFLLLGRFIERADMTSRIIEAAARMPDPTSTEKYAFTAMKWAGALHSLSGHQLYRQEMGPMVQEGSVQMFIVKKETFPRSLQYCIQQLLRIISSLPHTDLAENKLVELQQIFLSFAPFERDIPGFMDLVQAEISVIHNEIAKCFFMK
jgi:uncharacterized alpha-E superfamily protein